MSETVRVSKTTYEFKMEKPPDFGVIKYVICIYDSV